MSVVQINDVMLPDDRPLTVDDLLALPPEDGVRYELCYGVLEVSPAPFAPHEDSLHRLRFLLEHYRPTGFKVMGHQGINLLGDPTRHRIPDATVIREQDYEPKYIVQPPALVVEVASPRTALLDRNVKKYEYEEFGVESFWIVVPDPDKPSITAYELQDGKYVEAAHIEGDAIFRTTRPYDFEVSPQQLVTKGEWRPSR